jgi:hypothetical protein
MNYASYEEYVDDIVSMIPPEVEDDFAAIFKNHLMVLAENHWTQYLTGDRENYLLTEDEIQQSWKSASMELVERSLMNLIDMGLIETGVNKNGEIVYGASKEGLEYVKKLDK